MLVSNLSCYHFTDLELLVSFCIPRNMLFQSVEMTRFQILTNSTRSSQSLIDFGVCVDSSSYPAACRRRKFCVMAQFKIPCLLMRGGTSRGTYFLKHHLPVDRETTSKVLLRVMGSPDERLKGYKGSDEHPPHPGHRQVNGLGGDTSITSKVAIISLSKEQGVDIDYTFAQVLVDRDFVDWEPSCGNMLAGVGPAAIEMGLITKLGDPVTPIKIRATNNGALVEAIIQTPNHEVMYDGDLHIDGVPGTGAPITLNFMNVVGSKTGGKLLPTGKAIDIIDDVPVTCIDVAMPIVIAAAESLGKTGREKKVELDEDKEFFKRIEAIRVKAGEMMGLGDVRNRVIPKFAILSKPTDDDGSITARYFVPDSTHAAMAVTGAICIGCCCILQGSVAEPLAEPTKLGQNKVRVVIQHPSGRIQIVLDALSAGPGQLSVNNAGVLRTARLMFEGMVSVKRAGLGPSIEPQYPDLINFRNKHHRIHDQFRKLYHFTERQNKDGRHEWVDDEDTITAEDGGVKRNGVAAALPA